MPGHLEWEVRPREGGGWEGSVTFSMLQAGAPHRVQVSAPGHSPGHALEQAVTGADELVGTLDEMGFFPALALLPQLLPVLSEVAQRVRQGVEAATRQRTAYDPDVLGAEVVTDVMGDEQLGDELGFDLNDAFRAFGSVTQAIAPMAATFAQRGQGAPMMAPQGWAPPGGGWAPPGGGWAPPQGFAPPGGGWAPPQGFAPQGFAPKAPAKQVEPWRAW